VFHLRILTPYGQAQLFFNTLVSASGGSNDVHASVAVERATHFQAKRGKDDLMTI